MRISQPFYQSVIFEDNFVLIAINANQPIPAFCLCIHYHKNLYTLFTAFIFSRVFD